jgi:hypothetical protein
MQKDWLFCCLFGCWTVWLFDKIDNESNLQERTIKTARMAQECGSNTLENVKIEYPSSRSQLDSFRDVSSVLTSPTPLRTDFDIGSENSWNITSNSTETTNTHWKSEFNWLWIEWWDEISPVALHWPLSFQPNHQNSKIPRWVKTCLNLEIMHLTNSLNLFVKHWNVNFCNKHWNFLTNRDFKKKCDSNARIQSYATFAFMHFQIIKMKLHYLNWMIVIEQTFVRVSIAMTQSKQRLLLSLSESSTPNWTTRTSANAHPFIDDSPWCFVERLFPHFFFFFFFFFALEDSRIWMPSDPTKENFSWDLHIPTMFSYLYLVTLPWEALSRLLNTETMQQMAFCFILCTENSAFCFVTQIVLLE